MKSERKVGFVIIGAMKSATTSFHAYLNQHPKIYLSEPKEPDYFIKEKNWSKGLDWYQSLFDKAQKDQLLGEATTSYSKLPDFKGVAERIHQYNPDMKIIYLLRDPIERTLSHYRHTLGFGRVEDDFSKEIRKEGNRYVEYSLYFKQIEDYLRFFPLRNVLLIQSEKLIANPHETLELVYQFLELPNQKVDVSGRLNDSADKTQRSAFNKELKKIKVLKYLTTLMPSSLKSRYFKLTENKLPGIKINEGDFEYLKSCFEDDLNSLIEKFKLNNEWLSWKSIKAKE